MIKDRLRTIITDAIHAAQAAGDLPEYELPEVVVDHPKQADLGDFATPIAMQSAKLARKAPMQIADAILNETPRVVSAIRSICNLQLRVRKVQD